MKRLIVAVLFLCSFSVFAQDGLAALDTKISTQSSSYEYGSAIEVVLTAVNNSGNNVKVYFPDSREAYPVVDGVDYFLQFGLGASPSFWDVNIPANDSIVWSYVYPHENSPGEYLPEGEHLAFGQFYVTLDWNAGIWVSLNTDTIKFVVKNNSTGVDKSLKPHKFEVYQNYPNPFNPATNISFVLPQKMNIKIKVFDVLGKEVAVLADNEFVAGNHVVRFDASNFPSGVYYAQLIGEGVKKSIKMLLLK